MDGAFRHLEGGRARVIRIVVFVVVVILAFIGVQVFNDYSVRHQNEQNNDPRYNAQLFVDALARQDASTSFNMLSKKFIQGVSSGQVSRVDTWNDLVKSAFANVSGRPTFVEELPIHDPDQTYGKGTDAKRYVYSFSSEGTSHKAPFVLVREQGTWKIAEIGSFD